MDLAFVDELASQNNGVKYLLVAVDIFPHFDIVQTMKTKDAKDTLQAFKKRFLGKTLLKKFWIDEGTEYGGTFKKFSKKAIEVYSTMSETKAAFLEKAIQSLKHIIYRCKEDQDKNILSQSTSICIYNDLLRQ